MRKSNILFILGVLGIAFLASCGPPGNFGKETMVTISGKYVDEIGQPLPNHKIGMWILSLTGIYQENYWYPAPTNFVYTYEDGTFEFRLKGENFLWANGTSKYIIIANLDSLENPVTSMGFFVIDSINDLPDAKLWKANVAQALSSDTASAVFTWNSVKDVAGSEPPKNYGFSSRVVYWDLWHENEITSGFSLPTYIFQNMCTGWRIKADFPRANDNEMDVSYMSETYAEQGNANLLPDISTTVLSKGKSAFAAGHADTNYSKLTNQVWHEWEAFNNTYPAWVMLDLGESKSVSAAAVYGLVTNYANANNKTFENFEVYVSDDTTSWGAAVSTNDMESGYLRFEFTAKQGRYVKFQADSGSNIRIAWIREFTAFGPP